MNNNKESDDYFYYIARKNIKKYRNIAKITTKELAERTGYTHQYIQDLECLKIVKRPRLDTLGRIARALKIDIRKLFDDIR